MADLILVLSFLFFIYVIVSTYLKVKEKVAGLKNIVYVNNKGEHGILPIDNVLEQTETQMQYLFGVDFTKENGFRSFKLNENSFIVLRNVKEAKVMTTEEYIKLMSDVKNNQGNGDDF